MKIFGVRNDEVRWGVFLRSLQLKTAAWFVGIGIPLFKDT